MNRALILLFLTGCTLQHPYMTPDIEIPCKWHSDISPSLSLDTAALEPLQDELLNELLECAVADNLDIQIAKIRVLKARSLANAKKGDLYPHIDVSLTAGDIQSKTLQKLLECRAKRNLNFYEMGFDAEWEIDFFGKTAYDISALKAQAEGSSADLEAIWVTLSAEIAKNYIELRGLQAKQNLFEQRVSFQKQEVNLSEDMGHRGLINPRDLAHIQAEISSLQAELPLIELDIARTIHRLSVLVGLAPGELFECLACPQALPILPCQTAIGLPSELLRRRPDIQKAEKELEAATHQVGSAIASLFPRISLWGFIGDISTSFSHSSFTWALGPKILVPIFNSRLILQDVEYNKLSTQEALYHYKKTVLEAIEEAENAIFAYRAGEERVHLLEEAYAIELEALQHEEKMVQRGVSSSLVVAQAMQLVLAKEEALLQGQVEQLLHYLALYKALGGTWNIDN